jgi:hypothetical protein
MKDILLKLSACAPVIKWAGDKTSKEIIDTCHRGDWLLWLAYTLKVDDRPLTLAKGHCANTVRHLMKDERSIKAVDCAISYGNGEISKEELKAAAAAAYAAYAAYATTASAYSAAYASTASAYSAAYAAAADYAYANSADAAAAAYSAAYATTASAKKSNQLKTADICRKYLGHLILEKL